MARAQILHANIRNRPSVDVQAMRLKLESAGANLRSAILRCAPRSLLAFLWQQASMHDKHGDRDTSMTQAKPDDIGMAMEYLHAVLSSYATNDWGTDTSNNAMHAVLRDAAEVKRLSMTYSYLVSCDDQKGEFSHYSDELHFQALSSWILSRAYRYGVLESEFLKFALSPHDDALLQAYGVNAETIANGLQAAVMALLKPRKAARYDLNNVTRTSGLPVDLLDDLSYRPGENTEFFGPDLLKGTPLHTLPGRIKPLIHLDDGHYACDPYFLRDSAYRAIERGLRERIPGSDATPWKERQTAATEAGFAKIFERQLMTADIMHSVCYRAVSTGNWCELDLLVRLDDVLLIVEVKGGVMPTHSPELDFGKHSTKVEKLIKESYDQGKRFLEYANSKPEVTLYQVDKHNKKKPVGKLRLSDYRLVFPIILTIESFVPFAASSNKLPGIDPILGRFPIISMAIDELLILSRFLPTAGELMHYLTVRQRLAGIKELTLIDEADYLGLYVSHKRYDIAVDFIVSQGIERIVHGQAAMPVNAYFDQDKWEQKSPPRQHFPKRVKQILRILDSERRRGFVRTDAIIRDLGEEKLEQLESRIETELPHLTVVSHRRILFAGKYPCVLCLQRAEHVDVLDEHRRAAQDAADTLPSGTCHLLIVQVRNGEICGAWGASMVRPPGIAKS